MIDPENRVIYQTYKKEIRSRPPNSGTSDILYLARYKFTFSNNYNVLQKITISLSNYTLEIQKFW